MKKESIKIRRKVNPFVQIDNSVFNDNRLSYKAKGILGYLLSKPDNWTVRLEDLYNHTIEGYSSIRTGINELILTGYMELRTKYSRNGECFDGRRLEVYEEPLFKNGFRCIKNKSKNFILNEELLEVNPFGNKKVFK
ncbi:MAG: helix-turn-helix domain-containing protein [Flavobacteriaceae bacterium]|nr:helix-turn-helix domain-containing protein [Flavobacteriaceae bacterium]